MSGKPLPKWVKKGARCYIKVPLGYEPAVYYAARVVTVTKARITVSVGDATVLFHADTRRRFRRPAETLIQRPPKGGEVW